MSGQDAATATATTTLNGTVTALAAPSAEASEQQVPRGIGASVPATDARAKTEGTFPYAADLWAEGLLWAAVLRSPHAHARILSIDTTAAAAMPGVRAVVTHADVPGATTHGRRIADRPVFAHDVVRHHGEPIAAVAADHPDTARLAAAAIAVEYELLDPVTDPEQSFGAPALHPDGNLIRHIPLRYGDPEATGDVVVEGLYRIGRQDPAPIGAEAGLAVPRPDGGVELYTASTDPHTDRALAAACFGLEPDRVRVVVTGVPGATADREDAAFQLPLGLLALRTGCPVKLAATREESFLGHTHRHPTLLRYRHHADAEGRLVKVEAQILMDAGAYADASAESLAAAVAFACGPYVVPHAFVEGWAVRTNNPLRPRPRRGRHAGVRRVRRPDGQTGRSPRHGRCGTAHAQRPGDGRPAPHRPDRDLPGPRGGTAARGPRLRAARPPEGHPGGRLAAAGRPGGRGRAGRGAPGRRLRRRHGAHARRGGHGRGLDGHREGRQRRGHGHLRGRRHRAGLRHAGPPDRPGGAGRRGGGGGPRGHRPAAAWARRHTAATRGCRAARWSARPRWSAPNSCSPWPTSWACRRSSCRSRTAGSRRTTAPSR